MDSSPLALSAACVCHRRTERRAKRSFGKDGEDRIIEVPVGTAVFDAETGAYICEITEDGQEIKLLRGGKGGLGNWHFATSTNRTALCAAGAAGHREGGCA